MGNVRHGLYHCHWFSGNLCGMRRLFATSLLSYGNCFIWAFLNVTINQGCHYSHPLPRHKWKPEEGGERHKTHYIDVIKVNVSERKGGKGTKPNPLTMLVRDWGRCWISSSWGRINLNNNQQMQAKG